MLSDDLIQRLAQRAADAATRVDATPPDGTPGRALFHTIHVGLGAGGASEPAALPAPASAAEIADAEDRLGFPLPAELAQVYRGIANGGFGPHGGLAAAADAADRYLRLAAEPLGEQGERWPSHLLPIDTAEPGAMCIDRRGGQVVYWDEESLADEPAIGAWDRSFREEAPSLGAWLERWIARRPASVLQQVALDEAMRANVKVSLDHWRSLTPEERADFGLSETGWESELFGHLGIDLDGL